MELNFHDTASPREFKTGRNRIIKHKLLVAQSNPE